MWLSLVTFAPGSGAVVLALVAALLAFIVVSTLVICTGRGALEQMRQAGHPGDDPCEGAMRELELELAEDEAK